MLSTKIIYDYVFRRYSAENPQGVLSKVAAITQTPFVYPCNDHFLTGSLYSDGNGEKGLIVFTPGFRAQSFEYESVISAFLQEGFDVFAFDPTGHGNSEGKS
ncbi:MAG: alpha/beta hydrolase, partial [Clostridia bacterium]|nr:alpha/beta hydrolase [Clostridia bacterium]